MEYLIQARIVDGYRPGVSPAVEEITPEGQVCGVRGDRMPPTPGYREQPSIERGMDKTDIHHILDNSGSSSKQPSTGCDQESGHRFPQSNREFC